MVESLGEHMFVCQLALLLAEPAADLRVER